MLTPFIHSYSDAELATGPVGAEIPWKHWFTRFNKPSSMSPSLRATFDYSFSLMPWARNLLFPEFIGIESDDVRRVSATGVQDTFTAIRSSFAKLGATVPGQYLHHATRLTWTGQVIASGAPLSMRFRDRGQVKEIALQIPWLDAVLFPDSVGVLIARVEITDDLRLPELAMTMRYLKKLAYRRRLEVDVPTLMTSDGEGTTWLAFIADALSHLGVDSDGQERSRVADELRQTIGVAWTPFTLPFINISERPEKCSDPFQDYLEEVAFSVATGKTYEGRVDNRPSQELLRRVRDRADLRMWDSWVAIHHWDSLVMPVLRGSEELDDIFKSHLENTEHEYMAMYMLVIVQGAYVDLFSARLAEFSGDVELTSAKLGELETSLVRFETRAWHPRVSATPVGQPIFEMLEQSAHMSRRLEDLRQRIGLLKAHLRERREASQEVSTRRFALAIQVLSFILLPLTLVATLFQPLFNRFSSDGNSLPIWVPWVALAGVAILLVVLLVLIRRVEVRRDEF